MESVAFNFGYVTGFVFGLICFLLLALNLFVRCFFGDGNDNQRGSGTGA